ncbi:hypothetical protein BDR06DRAFT_964116 [Suillus hirtellus]|nr:hypothetical protein BDR06DRAFT_964116 [Suillus hirtellus]
MSAKFQLNPLCASTPRYFPQCRSTLSPALTLFHTLSYYNKIVHPSFSLSFILRLQFCHRSSTHWITFVIFTVAVFLGHLQSASLLSIAMVLAMPSLLQAMSLSGRSNDMPDHERVLTYHGIRRCLTRPADTSNDSFRSSRASASPGLV